MEKLMTEVRTYADLIGVEPSTVVQRAGAGNGGTWSRWQKGSSCTMHTAERLRRYMADNPPKTLAEAE